VQLPARSVPTKHYLIVKRGRIEAFLVLDYMSRAPEVIGALAGWVQEAKLNYKIDVQHGLENACDAAAAVRRQQ
jgi:NADPH-dependent curcumin reductase CurA